jgi:hypothetical protein
LPFLFFFLPFLGLDDLTDVVGSLAEASGLLDVDSTAASSCATASLFFVKFYKRISFWFYKAHGIAAIKGALGYFHVFVLKKIFARMGISKGAHLLVSCRQSSTALLGGPGYGGKNYWNHGINWLWWMLKAGSTRRCRRSCHFFAGVERSSSPNSICLIVR